MNRLILMVGFLFFGLICFSQRIAVIDSDSVLKSMPEYDLAQDILKKQREDYQQIYDSLVAGFQEMYQEGLNIARCLGSSYSMEEIETFLINREKLMFFFKNEMEKNLLKLEHNLKKIVKTELHKQATFILKETRHNYLMEKDSFIFFPAKSDITKQVINRLKTRKEEKIASIFLEIKDQKNGIISKNDLFLIEKGIETQLFLLPVEGVLKYDFKIKATLNGCKGKIYGFWGL